MCAIPISLNLTGSAPDFVYSIMPQMRGSSAIKVEAGTTVTRMLYKPVRIRNDSDSVPIKRAPGQKIAVPTYEVTTP